MSPALAGGFLTTEPPGKSLASYIFLALIAHHCCPRPVFPAGCDPNKGKDYVYLVRCSSSVARKYLELWRHSKPFLNLSMNDYNMVKETW